jgi:hypothetical protein
LDWESELSLYRAGVEAAPSNEKLHHNLAYHLTDPSKEFHLREAIRLYPPYVSAYINLGAYLSGVDRTAEAIDVYKQARSFLDIVHFMPNS